MSKQAEKFDPNIDPVEFYEKYYRLEGGQPLPKLSDWDKDFLRNAHKIPAGAVFVRSRQYKKRFLSDILKELENLKK